MKPGIREQPGSQADVSAHLSHGSFTLVSGHSLWWPSMSVLCHQQPPYNSAPRSAVRTKLPSSGLEKNGLCCPSFVEYVIS